MNKWEVVALKYISDHGCQSCWSDDRGCSCKREKDVMTKMMQFVESAYMDGRRNMAEEAGNIAEAWYAYNVPIKSIGPKIAAAIRDLASKESKE